MSTLPNFLDYQIGKSQSPSVENSSAAIALDQDTAITDAMCHVAQIFFDTANDISRNIGLNSQYLIDIQRLHRAELALAYVQGIDFGLVLDDTRSKLYLCYMEESMETIKMSMMNGFQTQIKVPPVPSIFFGYDETKIKMRVEPVHFIRPLIEGKKAYLDERIKMLREELINPIDKVEIKVLAPAADESIKSQKKPTPKVLVEKKQIEERKMLSDDADEKVILSKDIQEIAKECTCDLKSLSLKKICSISSNHWAVVFALNDVPDDDVVIKAHSFSKGLEDRGYKVPTYGLFHKGSKSELIYYVQKPKIPVKDAPQEVNKLRELYRTKRIGRESYQGGIASLLACGIINKSEFTRLSNYRI